MTTDNIGDLVADDGRARRWLERRRWPYGVHCPHCSAAEPYSVEADPKRRIRPGLYECSRPRCGRQFTVTTGNIFKGTKVPLGAWINLWWLVAASRIFMSKRDLQREFSVSYRTARFMVVRLNLVLKTPELQASAWKRAPQLPPMDKLEDMLRRVFAIDAKRADVIVRKSAPAAPKAKRMRAR
jgi:hypothetical protein